MLYFEPKLRIVEGDAQSVIKDHDEEIRGCSVTLQNPGSDVKEVCVSIRGSNKGLCFVVE